MYNPGYVNPGPTKSLTDLKPRNAVLSSAGRFISGQNDPIQHNFRYRPDTEKARKEEEAIELEKLRRFQANVNYDQIARASPTVYNSYANNLEKLNLHRQKVDAHAYEMENAKNRIYNDQQNVINLQKLSRLNAETHKQHMQNQLERIRGPARDPVYSPMRPGPSDGRNLNANQPFISDTSYDMQLDLLDQFSANKGLDDQLGGYAKYGRQQTRKADRPDPLQAFLEAQPNPNYRAEQNFNQQPRGDYYPLPVINQDQNPNPYQNRPMERPTAQYNPPVNPQQQPYNVPQYNIPYGFGAPQAAPENNELKLYMQKQNELLERLGSKLAKDNNASYVQGRSNEPDFERRLKEVEREAEMKFKMMAQQQMIDNLQQERNRRSFQNQSPKKDGPRGSEAQDPTHQGYLNPQNLAQNVLQYAQPSDNVYNPYMNYQYNPYMMYGAYGGYGGYPYDMYGNYYSAGLPEKKKKKKKRKDSEDDEDSQPESDGSEDYSYGRSKSMGKSHKSKKKDKKKGKKKSRKERAKSNLKTVLWAIAYPHLFAADISNKVVKRMDAQQKNILENSNLLTENFSTWLMNVAQEGFTQLFNDAKKNYDIIGSEFKKISKSDAVKRAVDLKKVTEGMLGALLNKTDAFPIEDKHLELLAVVCYQNMYASDNTFTMFELMRLKLSTMNKIVDGTKEQDQLRIAVILLVRILCFQLIFNAGVWNNKTKWGDQALINFKVLASLIYRITCSIWEDGFPIINPTPAEQGIQPLAPLSMDPLVVPTDQDANSPEMILAAYTRAQFALLFDEDKQWVDNMKGIIWAWTEKMYQKVAEYRQRVPATRPKEDEPQENLRQSTLPDIKH